MPEVLGASQGAIGLAPYGDQTEHTGPPQIITIPDQYREFLATDARSLMITLYPQHYNFIPNPAFRVGTEGWSISGFSPRTDAYSWTFVSDTAAANTGLLNSIIAGTTSVVAPDPSTVAYVNGQIVYVSGAEVWLVIDDALTLTVAEAATVGLALSSDVTGFRLWDVSTDALSAEDSWSGQSLILNGAGSLQHRAGSGFIYVGPRDAVDDIGYEDAHVVATKRMGPEWTFSVYVRGSGRVRLKMDAYYPENRTGAVMYDHWDAPTVADPSTEPAGEPYVLNSNGEVWTLIEGATAAPYYEALMTNEETPQPKTPAWPEYQDLTTVADPFVEPSGDPAILGPDGVVWTLIDPAPSEAPFYESQDRPPAFETVQGPWQDIENDGQWHRVVVTTRARVEENEGRVSFIGAWWISAQIEVESSADLRLSAAMLDPSEYPECQYFDGDMVEDPDMDDFLWEGAANNSVSLYYFDRRLRAQWLCERLQAVVPIGRPFQIFFNDYQHPFSCSEGLQT